MALGLSPQRLREVRFAEQWRGYRTNEVDAFVDRVAEAFDALEARLREAVARADRAEKALHERGSEERVSRTLVLAERTADAALREAQGEATRLVEEATRRASEVVAEAEARAALQRSEMDARAAAELHDLVERRRALEADVALLADYVQRQRGALAEQLRAQVRWLEVGDHLAPPPVSGPWSAAPVPSLQEPSSVEGGSVGGSRPTEVGDHPSTDDELVALVARAEALPRAFPSSDVASSTSATKGASPVPGALDVDAASAGDAALDGGGSEDSIEAADAPGLAPRLDGSAQSIEATDAPGPAPRLDGPEDHGGASAPEEAVVSDAQYTDLEQIPWRRPDAPEESAEAPSTRPATAPVDDPFLAELRRAVDDPEPLGPREDDDVWFDDGGLAGSDDPLSGRRRRRRQR